MEQKNRYISSEYLIHYCKIGQQSKCCRYLVLEAGGFVCGKKTNDKDIFDKRVTENKMVAQGDNFIGIDSF